ncbi:MAG TPA: hypothetical protein VGS96_10785 [Thermoanaerobaculia bacterium]|nr:hypothetical protein [Thermoanaerobaculia bacterium]
MSNLASPCEVRVEAFEKLLSALANERDAAAEQYERIRLKLLKYFEWRHCPDPVSLADEALDRVARRLDEGVRICSPELLPYVYGTARNVLFEFRKLQEREARTAAHLRVFGLLVRGDEERKETDRQLDCLDRCLNDLPEHARALLIRYYQRSGAPKVESRMELARELGIPMNALRIRIHRIKAELLRSIESYMRGCKQ